MPSKELIEKQIKTLQAEANTMLQGTLEIIKDNGKEKYIHVLNGTRTEIPECEESEFLNAIVQREDIEGLIEFLKDTQEAAVSLQEAIDKFSKYGKVYTEQPLLDYAQKYNFAKDSKQNLAILECLHTDKPDMFWENPYRKVCLVPQTLVSPSLPGIMSAILSLPKEEQELCALVDIDYCSIMKLFMDEIKRDSAYLGLIDILTALRNAGYRYLFLLNASVFEEIFDFSSMDIIFRDQFLKFNYKVIVGGVFSDFAESLLQLHDESNTEIQYGYILPSQLCHNYNDWRAVIEQAYPQRPKDLIEFLAAEAFYQDKFLLSTSKRYGSSQWTCSKRVFEFDPKIRPYTPEALPQAMLDITYYCAYSTFTEFYDSIELGREYQEFMTELALRLPEPYSSEFSLDKLRETETYALIYNTGLLRTATTDDGKEYDYISHPNIAHYCGQMMLDGLAKKFSLPTAKLEEATAALEEYVAEHQTILAKTFALSKIGNFYSFER